MKRWLALLLVIPVLLLSACAVAQVSYRLGDDFSVNMDYLLEIKPSDADAIQYTNDITKYWTDMGFSATFDENDGVFTLTGTKKDAYESSDAAAQAFSELVTADQSLFQDAKFVYTPSFDIDHYSLTATVSLQDIIRQSEVQNIPEGEIETLESSAQDGSYTLRIALPGEVVSTNADSQADGYCIWTLTYGEVTQISVESRKPNQENTEYYAALQEQQRQDEQLLLICVGAIVVVLAALVTVTIIRKRKNRPLKVRVKKF